MYKYTYHGTSTKHSKQVERLPSPCLRRYTSAATPRHHRHQPPPSNSSPRSEPLRCRCCDAWRMMIGWKTGEIKEQSSENAFTTFHCPFCLTATTTRRRVVSPKPKAPFSAVALRCVVVRYPHATTYLRFHSRVDAYLLTYGTSENHLFSPKYFMRHSNVSARFTLRSFLLYGLVMIAAEGGERCEAVGE